MPKAKRQAVSVGETLPERVEAVRKARGWSQEQLAERLTSLGVPTHQTVVAKIENAKRRVTVDDLLVLAAALGVSPATLMLPSESGATVAVTPSVVEPAARVRFWLGGRLPLDPASRRFHFEQMSDDEWRVLERGVVGETMQLEVALELAAIKADPAAMRRALQRLLIEAQRGLEQLDIDDEGSRED